MSARPQPAGLGACCFAALRTHIVQPLGAFEEDRLFSRQNNENCSRVEQAGSLLLTLFLFLHMFMERPELTRYLSFSLKETIPDLLRPVHCKHPTEASSPFLCDPCRLGESTCVWREGLFQVSHWGKWCTRSEHPPWSKPSSRAQILPWALLAMILYKWLIYRGAQFSCL